MPVAESEIVTGYQAEYSGLRFLLFFIGEFATGVVFAAIAVHALPRRMGRPVARDDNDWYYVLGPLVLFAKMMLVVVLIFWVRFTYPRFREDQLQRFAWKFLIPLSLVNIVVTAVLKVAF